MTAAPQFVVNVEAAVYRDGSGVVGGDAEDAAGEFLLAERAAEEDHAAGALSLIGGKVEIEEPTADVLERTVRRELQEEAGVEVDELHYLSSVAFQADTGTNVVNVVFLGRYAGGEPRVREPDEVAALHWRTLARARADPDLPGFTENYLEQASETVERLGWVEDH